MPSPTQLALPGPYEHTYVHTRGLRLHVATSGDTNKPLMLLLHGSRSGWFEYQHVLPLLAAAGYHVCAVSQRGYGLSDRPPNGYEIRHAVGDISGTIQALGHDNAIVVGTDTGGVIGWALAATQPERVRALITIDAIHPTDLRRAIAARPWLYGSELIRWPLEQIFRRPLSASSITNGATEAKGRIAQFTALCQYSESLEKARIIAVKNTRLRYTWVPSNWFSAKAQAPVLLLHQQQPRWRHLVRRAATRTSNTVTAFAIPTVFSQSKFLPQIEEPTEYTRVLVQYLRTLGI